MLSIRAPGVFYTLSLAAYSVQIQNITVNSRLLLKKLYQGLFPDIFFAGVGMFTERKIAAG